eukprot:gene4285-biopygen12507
MKPLIAFDFQPRTLEAETPTPGQWHCSSDPAARVLIQPCLVPLGGLVDLREIARGGLVEHGVHDVGPELARSKGRI